MLGLLIWISLGFEGQLARKHEVSGKLLGQSGFIISVGGKTWNFWNLIDFSFASENSWITSSRRSFYLDPINPNKSYICYESIDSTRQKFAQQDFLSVYRFFHPRREKMREMRKEEQQLNYSYVTSRIDTLKPSLASNRCLSVLPWFQFPLNNAIMESVVWFTVSCFRSLSPPSALL